MCYPYWSHDIGGHFPGPVEDELYVRWIQWAAFNPVRRDCRFHCAIVTVPPLLHLLAPLPTPHVVVSVRACEPRQFLRTHSTRSELGERRIGKMEPAMFAAARDAGHRRYALLPYIYTTARQCYDTGLPLNR